MEEIIIRPYSKEDRELVRDIAYETAFLGDSADIYFDDKELLADILTLYFTDYQPDSCFVAVSNNEVIGYLLGSKDISLLSKYFNWKIIFKLLFKAIRRNVFLKTKNTVFLINLIKSLLKGEFKSPDFSKDYPAVLHVNIKENYRNQGFGSRMIDLYLQYLKKENVSGVHFSTLSDKAAHFYEKLGFVLLHKTKRSYFKNILHRDVTCYAYGKKIT
ncbi:MAG: GNAT family N-acetyltransferase [Candidatus Omnitrophota bacterium]